MKSRAIDRNMTQRKWPPVLLLSFVAALMILFAVYCCCPPIHEELIVEAGSELPSANAFPKKEIRWNMAYGDDLHRISTDVPGTYEVTLVYCGIERSSRLTIVDTTPPQGTAREQTLHCPESLPEPDSFLVSVSDATDVTAAYKEVPSIDTDGEYDITIVLTDTSGNTSEVNTRLTVIWDTTAPVITGVQDLEVYAGDTVSYRSGVTVSDDLDPQPLLSIDSSAVDLSRPGVYPLTYTAADAAGNSSTATVSVTVYEKKDGYVEPDVIYREVDALLAKFITDDMTDREKVEAVFCWVSTHTQYSGYSDKSDWLQAAYNFMQIRRGDCFSYFSLNKLMLQRLGIPTIDVEKVKNNPQDSMHYWLLVSVDGGETYYHLDNVWSMTLCLVTDQVLDYFSMQNNNCFNRDISLYPPTPEESLPESDMPWDNPAILNA